MMESSANMIGLSNVVRPTPLLAQLLVSRVLWDIVFKHFPVTAVEPRHADITI